LLGSEVCRRLRARGRDVVAMVRPTSNRDRLESLRGMGARLVQADLKEPASLPEVCHGAESIISTVSTTLSRQEGDSIPSVDQEGQLALVDAARAAGVRHFVYVSYSGNFDAGRDPSPLTVAKRSVERRLRESGLTYTILRPSCFMEVWLGPALGFDHAAGKVQVYGSGQNRLSWISLRDVAAFAVESLDNPAARNAVIELGGPAALSYDEVIGIFEQASGRRFEVQRVPAEVFAAQRAEATDPLQKSFAALMMGVAEGDEIDMRQTLAAFPIELTTVRDYARAVTAGR
jgi:uncharacterized protein YbjT (DUF2867 family)